MQSSHITLRMHNAAGRLLAASAVAHNHNLALIKACSEGGAEEAVKLVNFYGADIYTPKTTKVGPPWPTLI